MLVLILNLPLLLTRLPSLREGLGVGVWGGPSVGSVGSFFFLYYLCARARDSGAKGARLFVL